MTTPWPYGQLALRPLDQYWSDARQDHFATSTVEGADSAVDAGYALVRTEASVLGLASEHTVPLRSYVDPGQGDHLTVCSPQGEEDARVAGYQPVRVEGHVFRERPTKPVTPLRLYANGARHDNLLAATRETAWAADEAGYGFVRTEGFAPANVPGSLTVTRRERSFYLPDDEYLHVVGSGFDPGELVEFYLVLQGRYSGVRWQDSWLQAFGYRLIERRSADGEGRILVTLGQRDFRPPSGAGDGAYVEVEGLGLGHTAGLESTEDRAAARGADIVAHLPASNAELLLARY